jgi:hypothetical protein
MDKIIPSISNLLQEFPTNYNFRTLCIALMMIPVILFTVDISKNVAEAIHSTELPWVTEEWINPNFSTSQNFNFYKIILNCQDSDNNCANNILTGGGISDISVYGTPSPLCDGPNPCFYGKSSNVVYSGGNKATIAGAVQSGSDVGFWTLSLFYSGSTLSAVLTIDYGCPASCTTISTGAPREVTLENRKSASELIVKTKIINDDGGSARPSDFNTFIYHELDCGIGLCGGPILKDQVQPGKEDGSIYHLRYSPGNDPSRPVQTAQYYVNIEQADSPLNCYAHVNPTVEEVSCDSFDGTVGYDINFGGDCFNLDVILNRNIANGNPYECLIVLNDKPIDLTTDSDGDNIPNYYERNGYDINKDKIIDLDLPKLGADPNHKDLFIEVDYMNLHQPIQKAIENVKTSFANAPLSNPDRKMGINLHVIVDDEVPHIDQIDISILLAIKQDWFGTASERSNPNAANIISAKEKIYHYGLYGHDRLGDAAGSSGVSNGIPGMEFIVSLGGNGWGKDPVTGHTVGSLSQQEGTFMHELGHNLDLGHGGNNHINCKPNYLSVMTYGRQFPSLISDRPLDYSRSVLNQLNEAGLNENAGIIPSTPPGLKTVYGPPPIVIVPTGFKVDWNRDNDFIDPVVTADITNIGSCGSSPNEILDGHDDWNNLVYRVGNINFVSINTIEQDELTIDDVIEHRMLLLDAINNEVQGVPNSDITLPATAFNLPSSVVVKNAINSESNPDVVGSIANKLQSKDVSDLDDSISMLESLRSKMDSSFEGSPTNDVITGDTSQAKIVPMIDNLIGVLELQK